MYGINEPVHRLIPQLIEHSKKRKEMIINNSNIRIDYSDVIDVCKKILKSSKFKGVEIKYPQVWNLASGKIITIEDFIKKYIKHDLGWGNLDIYPEVLYGGSVNLDNCEEIISSTDVDGLLIGGASLNSETFSKIYNLS